MNAITTAAIAAKSTIDSLLSNGKTSAVSGLIKGGKLDMWAYAEPFSGPEISVNYWHCENGWAYSTANNTSDSTFFSKVGTAKTLRKARLEALDAVVAGCAAQVEQSENGAKEELLNLMQNENHQTANQSCCVDCGVVIQQPAQGGLRKRCDPCAKEFWRQYKVDWNRRRIADGKCRICGKSRAGESTMLCSKCAIEQAEYHRKRRAQNAAKGNCLCGRPRQDGRAKCSGCIQSIERSRKSKNLPCL